MKVGVQASFPLALDIAPAQIARTQSPNAVAYLNRECDVIYQPPWDAHPVQEGAIQAKWVEWGNEPNDLLAYRQSLRTASPILRAAGRRVVLAASPGQHPLTLIAGTGEWNLVDAVALHPYAPLPAQVLGVVRAARRLVPDRLPLLVTEFGWSADGRGHDHPLVVSEEEQANKLRRTFKLLRENAKALNLHAALWFCWQDYEADHWWSGNGLRRLDGTERPAMDAFRDAVKAVSKRENK